MWGYFTPTEPTASSPVALTNADLWNPGLPTAFLPVQTIEWIADLLAAQVPLSAIDVPVHGVAGNFRQIPPSLLYPS